jgi:glycosyltransferase involved in cell wall biosynthesis
MRILVDVRQLLQANQSGVGEYTVQLLRALFRQDRKHEYVLLSSGMRQPVLRPELIDAPNVQHVHVRTANKILNLSIAAARQPRLNRLVSVPIDLVFLPNLGFSAIPNDLPYVLTVHDLSWKFFPQFFSRKQRLWHRAVRPDALIKNAACVITPSDATRRDVQRGYQKPDSFVRTVPHGIDPAFSAHPQARDHGVRSRYKFPRRFALFVGTLEPRKNIVAILEGMKTYRAQSRDDLHLVLVGGWGWNTRELKKVMKGLTWIHHLGYVAAEDRPALYRAAQVFVWPSIWEGFGLPVLEAMASGVPVITSSTSSLPELTAGAAVLVHPYRIEDISAAMREVLDFDRLRAQLRQQGLERAKTFSWDLAARQTLAVFEDVVDRRRNSHI